MDDEDFEALRELAEELRSVDTCCAPADDGGYSDSYLASLLYKSIPFLLAFDELLHGEPK